ncbi:ribonuclease H-like YkuK family protein [Patescibacteria group bacterium]
MESDKLQPNPVFFNSHGKSFAIDQVFCEIKNYIMRDEKASYEIVIGSDSQASITTSFVTSLVVRRIGNGGIYFWTRSKEKNSRTLRDRIWKETMLSITLAQEVRGRIKDVLGEELFWDNRVEFKHIHLDVGKKGPTREFIDSVTGMVKGFGFEPVIKPDAYGAFVVADLHT